MLTERLLVLGPVFRALNICSRSVLTTAPQVCLGTSPHFTDFTNEAELFGAANINLSICYLPGTKVDAQYAKEKGTSFAFYPQGGRSLAGMGPGCQAN